MAIRAVLGFGAILLLGMAAVEANEFMNQRGTVYNWLKGGQSTTVQAPSNHSISPSIEKVKVRRAD